MVTILESTVANTQPKDNLSLHKLGFTTEMEVKSQFSVCPKWKLKSQKELFSIITGELPNALLMDQWKDKEEKTALTQQI